ncbi:MAG: hypothetical protein Q9M91_03925 [Candidatus Dojkabacteria bacterium]|nr:hypothetical protein [Candidatus Dojkabacteria bacterium]
MTFLALESEIISNLASDIRYIAFREDTDESSVLVRLESGLSFSHSLVYGSSIVSLNFDFPEGNTIEFEEIRENFRRLMNRDPKLNDYDSRISDFISSNNMDPGIIDDINTALSFSTRIEIKDKTTNFQIQCGNDCLEIVFDYEWLEDTDKVKRNVEAERPIINLRGRPFSIEDK